MSMSGFNPESPPLFPMQRRSRHTAVLNRTLSCCLVVALRCMLYECFAAAALMWATQPGQPPQPTAAGLRAQCCATAVCVPIDRLLSAGVHT